MTEPKSDTELYIDAETCLAFFKGTEFRDNGIVPLDYAQEARDLECVGILYVHPSDLRINYRDYRGVQNPYDYFLLEGPNFRVEPHADIRKGYLKPLGEPSELRIRSGRLLEESLDLENAVEPRVNLDSFNVEFGYLFPLSETGLDYLVNRD